ncbi:aminotransferase class III-fold pyridoxal phosphate-dependent enzyme [Thermobifida halotolerans]|uniref:Aminotransferase class III-fold pyridoxal phosphate-dependent enzyme n=1 Tax=Thermobifida halotolerans TaxID=483545 RepID=A0AA97M5S9_9ACTN|nr:aminotransferase class III-fold pyridoxal phosphate-dependent enzyme [Thermobifida halotolerans]UOE21302.1 aminotransferase class III-fold pyridoxal phosphate-dependent enzyme [Thermobifida halotolerans]
MGSAARTTTAGSCSPPVATGFGRTGPYFAGQEWPEPPDILLASKGLTNGTCAAAAVVASTEVLSVFTRADASLVHAETQAGSPSTCAAITAVTGEMERLDALQNGKRGPQDWTSSSNPSATTPL